MSIEQAVTLLKAGELVAFPTETVYGLGACADNLLAVRKIFTVKCRPADHPVIVHICAESQLHQWVDFMPETALKLMQVFWPGPLTLIFKAKSNVSGLITGNQPTVGIRMPAHPIARILLQQLGEAIVAPSANRFGRISPTCAKHVQEELGNQVSLILDAGDCAYGIESTIIDVTQTLPVILRPGPLGIDSIKAVLGEQVNVTNSEAFNDHYPRVSGCLKSHYAPNTVLILIAYDQQGQQKQINALCEQNNIAVMAFDPKPAHFSAQSAWVIMPDDPVVYAKMLYATLRQLDHQQYSCIYVQMPPNIPAWMAVYDRLWRASHKK